VGGADAASLGATTRKEATVRVSNAGTLHEVRDLRPRVPTVPRHDNVNAQLAALTLAADGWDST
jgi:hypothetical protein